MQAKTSTFWEKAQFRPIFLHDHRQVEAAKVSSLHGRGLIPRLASLATEYGPALGVSLLSGKPTDHRTDQLTSSLRSLTVHVAKLLDNPWKTVHPAETLRQLSIRSWCYPWSCSTTRRMVDCCIAASNRIFSCPTTGISATWV